MQNLLRESRRLQRTRYTAEQHFDALDADADSLEQGQNALRSEFETGLADVRADIQSVRNVLVGLLVMISAGAVVGALNILFKLV